VEEWIATTLSEYISIIKRESGRSYRREVHRLGSACAAVKER